MNNDSGKHWTTVVDHALKITVTLVKTLEVLQVELPKIPYQLGLHLYKNEGTYKSVHNIIIYNTQCFYIQ